MMTKAKWVFSYCPTFHDERAVGCALVLKGEELAACLWSGGELDVQSDGCGVFSAGRDFGLSFDNVDWPSEAEALAAVWGRRKRRGAAR